MQRISKGKPKFLRGLWILAATVVLLAPADNAQASTSCSVFKQQAYDYMLERQHGEYGELNCNGWRVCKRMKLEAWGYPMWASDGKKEEAAEKFSAEWEYACKYVPY